MALAVYLYVLTVRLLYKAWREHIYAVRLAIWPTPPPPDEGE